MTTIEHAKESPFSQEDKEAHLRRLLISYGRVLVAFSGGVDSSFLATFAHDTLGYTQVLCVTAVSPSFPRSEMEDCMELAKEWGLRWRSVATNEMEDPRYVENGPDRCGRCKSALMEALSSIGEKEAGVILLGVNLDDLRDRRPGQVVAEEQGALFPLVEARFSKDAIRQGAKSMGLRIADKPAMACLSSRIPLGTPVTLGTLESVTKAEHALQSMGFRDVRVRHHGPVARIEVPQSSMEEILSRRDEVTRALREVGYSYVSLDLEGYRSGSMNRLIEAKEARNRGDEKEEDS